MKAANPFKTENFHPYDLALIASYARRFGPALSLGANAKWVREKIDIESAQAIAFDIGGLYTILNNSSLFRIQRPTSRHQSQVR